MDKLSTISSEQIEVICEQIIQQDIQSLTFEFEDGHLVYFMNQNGVINFADDSSPQHSQPKPISTAGNGSGKSNPTLESIPDFKKITPVIQNIDLSQTTLVHNSMLQPPDVFLKTYQKAEVFFSPLVAPGGDFYYFKDYQFKSLVIVGDCTGHGLQGAMIAMSIMTLIKQYFRLPPASLVESTYEFYDLLQDIREEENEGGFDAEVGFVLLDKRKKTIEYAGSGVKLIVKKPDGGQLFSSRRKFIKNKTLKREQIQLKSGDQLFIFTDGITDQFDHSNNKKLGAKSLLSLIESTKLDNSNLDNFRSQFDAFRGETQPLDDQTLLILTA